MTLDALETVSGELRSLTTQQETDKTELMELLKIVESKCIDDLSPFTDAIANIDMSAVADKLEETKNHADAQLEIQTSALQDALAGAKEHIVQHCGTEVL